MSFLPKFSVPFKNGKTGRISEGNYLLSTQKKREVDFDLFKSKSYVNFYQLIFF